MASKLSPEAQGVAIFGGLAALGLIAWWAMGSGGSKGGGGGGGSAAGNPGQAGLSIGEGCLNLTPVDAGRMVSYHASEISSRASAAISAARGTSPDLQVLADELTEDFINQFQAGCPTPPSANHPSYAYYQAVRGAFFSWLSAYAEAAKA